MWATTDSALEAYGLASINWAAWATLIAVMDGFRISHAVLQAIFIVFWAYLYHRILHIIFKVDRISGYLNPHTAFHHMKVGSLPRWLELTIEFGSDMMFYGGSVLLLQYLLGIHVLSVPMVIYSALMYTIGHVGVYSIIGSDYHKSHHTDTYCNYGPEFLDVFFGTRCDPSKPYNVMNLELLAAIPTSAAIIAWLFFTKGWSKRLNNLQL